MVYYDKCVFSEEITKGLQTWLLRPGSCQEWDQYISILPNWLKPLQYISPYRPMCKLHILNLGFKQVISIYETALRVDGPNTEPALSPYPPRTRPTVLAGNPPCSPHPRLLAPPRKCALRVACPAPQAAGPAGRGGAARADLSDSVWYWVCTE